MEAIAICPESHKRLVYGRCEYCYDWFTLRNDKRLRTHKDCETRILRLHPLPPYPSQLALLCVRDRHFKGAGR